MQRIKITRTSNSSIDSLDFNNIPFGSTFSDHMFEADYKDGEWCNFEIKPLRRLSLHPGNAALHYGQSIFEGMKATKHVDGTPLLFRPEMHSERINASADRMCMPTFPEDVFLEALHMLVDLERDWIPPTEGSALYIRPFMFATDEAIGVRPSKSYKFIICTLPVGPYYPKPVSLYADTEYIRAAHGGVGEAKTAGNYAASLYPAKKAMEKGFDQIMWLDAKEHKYVQEVGTMNIFFVIDGKLITPSTTGTILKGITRNSIIHILRDEGYQVEERLIDINEVISAAKDGSLTEIFGTGTAAVVAKVDRLAYQSDDFSFELQEDSIANKIKAIINGMRSGTIEDKYGWVVPVKSLAAKSV